MTCISVMQLESLKATTDTKEVSFKIAYGLPLSEMLRWGLYISGMLRLTQALLFAHCLHYFGQQERWSAVLVELVPAF